MRLLVLSLDLSSDLERQFHGGRRHPLGDERPDGFVNSLPRDGLAVRPTESSICTVTDIPGFSLSSPRDITDAQMSAALAADSASLQQGYAFARRRHSR